MHSVYYYAAADVLLDITTCLSIVRVLLLGLQAYV
jgi:hypothetical protein